MNRTTLMLRWLAGLFVVYEVVRTGVGIVWSWPTLMDLSGGGASGWPIPVGPFVAFGLAVELAVFGLLLWLFTRLLQRKPWARLVLLIVGWLAGLGALFGVLAGPGAVSLAGRYSPAVPGLDWESLAAVGLVQNVLGLCFWGYAIYVLQVDSGVRREFASAVPGCTPADQPR